MPSPLAHVAAGYAVYELHRRRSGRDPVPGGRVSSADRLLFVAVLTMLPDVDSAVGLLAGNFGRFHNNATHSLLLGLLVAVVVGLFIAWVKPSRPARWFFLALSLYTLHIVMDFFTISRGVMALWPLSIARYVSPVSLFYGFHWSDGLWSIRHVWTLITEATFAGILLLLLYGWPRAIKAIKCLVPEGADDETSQE